MLVAVLGNVNVRVDRAGFDGVTMPASSKIAVDAEQPVPSLKRVALKSKAPSAGRFSTDVPLKILFRPVCIVARNDSPPPSVILPRQSVCP